MNSLRSKNLYKLFLSIIKYTPAIVMCLDILATIFNYYKISIIGISILGGTSILFLIILFLIAAVFRFCNLFRIPLYYITTTKILVLVDNYVGIPITNITMFRVYLILGGLAILGFIYYYYKNRSKPKIDYIKQLCERYNCNCK